MKSNSMIDSAYADTVGRDLVALSDDISEWSQKTFGLDSERGPIGPLKHLAKEAAEAQAKPSDKTEYADCLILILDASRRAGIGPMALIFESQQKMIVNKTERTWPKPTSDEPVEHIRETADGETEAQANAS